MKRLIDRLMQFFFKKKKKNWCHPKKIKSVIKLSCFAVDAMLALHVLPPAVITSFLRDPGAALNLDPGCAVELPRLDHVLSTGRRRRWGKRGRAPLTGVA